MKIKGISKSTRIRCVWTLNVRYVWEGTVIAIPFICYQVHFVVTGLFISKWQGTWTHSLCASQAQTLATSAQLEPKSFKRQLIVFTRVRTQPWVWLSDGSRASGLPCWFEKSHLNICCWKSNACWKYVCATHFLARSPSLYDIGGYLFFKLRQRSGIVTSYIIVMAN